MKFFLLAVVVLGTRLHSSGAFFVQISTRASSSRPLLSQNYAPTITLARQPIGHAYACQTHLAPNKLPAEQLISTSLNAAGGSSEPNALSTGGSVPTSYYLNLATLMGITWMWALQTPSVRYMYNTVQHAPPVAIMNAGGALAALVTVLLFGLFQNASSSSSSDANDATQGPPLLRDTEAQKGGLELGTYKFFGVGCNLLGISLTLSSQAAFCVQLTTIIVPLAQAAMGVKLKPQIWVAVAMAFSGVGLLTLDGAANVGAANLHDLLLGDAFCVLAACFYACYDVRVNTWSKRAATLPLTTYKTAFQSLYACAAVAGLVLSGSGPGQQIVDWCSQVTAEELKLVVAVIIFSGAFANGIATLLQVGAQRDVGPSRAQLIYSTNPLWNSLIATLVLGETIKTVGIVGACLFLSALGIAAATPPDSTDSAAADVVTEVEGTASTVSAAAAAKRL